MSVNQQGVSLVELVLVASAVIFLSLLIGNLPSSMSSINKSRHLSIAREIAGKQIEYLRKQPFGNLVDGVNFFTDQDLATLTDASATYEIEDCPPAVCVLGETVKKIKVEISWNEGGANKKVEATTIIAEGGITQ